MNIRFCDKNDVTEIQKLISQLGYDTPVDEILHSVNNYNKVDDGYVFVAEENNKLIGLIAGYVFPYFHRSGSILRIVALIVVEDNRRTGIGSALFNRIEKIAVKKKCDKIEVTSGGHRSNSAYQFYQNIGFSPYDGTRFLKNI